MEEDAPVRTAKSSGGRDREPPSPPDGKRQIRVLHADRDVVVIYKPCDLRSVPGHARPPPTPGSGSRRSESEEAERRDVDDNADAPGDADANGGGTAEETTSTGRRRTAQEAWTEAVRSFANDSEEKSVDGGGKGAVGGGDPARPEARVLLRNLAQTPETSAPPSSSGPAASAGSATVLSAVPRRRAAFARYCRRSMKRLIPDGARSGDGSRGKTKRRRLEDGGVEGGGAKNGASEAVTNLERVIEEAYDRIRERQVPLLNLPEPTQDEDSAWGQLRLMGYHGKKKRNDKNGDVENGGDCGEIYVVHRLDCATSGVMVFARNHRAASSLCAAWRRRGEQGGEGDGNTMGQDEPKEAGVEKIYAARVARWPPHDERGETEGTINLPLAPSRTERIKWEVRVEDEGGKASITRWKVLLVEDGEGSREEKKGDNAKEGGNGVGVTLELEPITGRTHQLRIHCAAVGSGIVGDSLYGDRPVEYRSGGGGSDADGGGGGAATFLHLHAQKLTFPHPTTGKATMFEIPRPW